MGLELSQDQAHVSFYGDDHVAVLGFVMSLNEPKKYPQSGCNHDPDECQCLSHLFSTELFILRSDRSSSLLWFLGLAHIRDYIMEIPIDFVNFRATHFLATHDHCPQGDQEQQ
jgi:hypothetical protein